MANATIITRKTAPAAKVATPAAKAPAKGKTPAPGSIHKAAMPTAATAPAMRHTLPLGHFVAVHMLANPKGQGTGAASRYAALLALVAKQGNGKFTVAQWRAVSTASDLRYNTGTNGYGKAFVTVHPTQVAALAALAPKVAKAKAPKAKAAPVAPAATPAA